MNVGDNFVLRGHDVHAMAMGDCMWAMIVTRHDGKFIVATTRESWDDASSICMVEAIHEHDKSNEESVRTSFSKALESMARAALNLPDEVKWPLVGEADAEWPRFHSQAFDEVTGRDEVLEDALRTHQKGGD